MAPYDPEPLRRARADDEFIEKMTDYLQRKLLMNAVPDALDVAGNNLEDNFDVPKSIARLASYLVFRNMLDGYANWWAGEALANGLPQTAIAEALGYRTSSNLATQLPDMRKFRDARLKVRRTGKPQTVQTSNGNYIELFPTKSNDD